MHKISKPEIHDATNNQRKNIQTSGCLLKWGGYFKGYEKRWFVLQNGHLSCYRKNEDDTLEACGDCIQLFDTVIKKIDRITISVSKHSQRLYIRSLREEDCEFWYKLLDSAKTQSLRSSSDMTPSLSHTNFIKTGWLLKYTNIFQQYKRTFFKLQDGHFSYYRILGNQTTCVGCIPLVTAAIEKQGTIEITIANKGRYTCRIRTLEERDCDSWCRALNQAKSHMETLSYN